MAKNKNLKKIQELQELYEEVSDYLTNLLDDYRRQEEENRYQRVYPLQRSGRRILLLPGKCT